MKQCVLCQINNTLYGIQHGNGNAICMACVMKIREAHIKVREFPYEEMEASV
jgi:hypothetical protein